MKQAIDIQPLIKAAEAGGRVIADYFGQVLEVEEKSMAADCRTKADTEAEQAILAILQKECPDYAIYSEESGQLGNHSDYRLIIDPLDGSHNFVLGIPQFAVSIGLTYKDMLVAGAVHHPILKKTYHAIVGQGAYINNARIRANGETEMNRASIAYTNNYIADRVEITTIISALEILGAKRILRNWAVALDFCLLADGKIEAVIINGGEIYDFSAGKLIAAEAGAIMTDFTGTTEPLDLGDRFIATSSEKLNWKIRESMPYGTNKSS